MKAVIIAAGQGTRLRARAPSKPLAEVAGVPLIERVAGCAAAAGATGLLVVTGYRAEPLEAFLPELAARTRLAVETVRNEEWARPNGLSALLAAERLAEPFLLLMADHLFDPAIARDLAVGARPGAALTLAVDRNLHNPDLDMDDATKVRTDGGRIVAIGKSLADYDAVDTGVFWATPALAAAIRADLESGGEGSLSGAVGLLGAEGRADARDISGRWWIDVDDEAALLRAEDALTKQEHRPISGRRDG